ncbi:uncharacterized protein LOC120108697 [Phoenix dactylifera]|uniref:Uncharacterized protein LOC120108697 n=1 Tax=Phoenix dactylifera TaxID=42345 RepID=A0A8B8ZY70_PHODC|nr:uncharacterized protein LOC120108697 [Phoenix dactylifera]
MGGGSALRPMGRAVGVGAAKGVLSAAAGAATPATPARILPISSASPPPPSVATSSSAASWHSHPRELAVAGHLVFEPAPSREEAEAAVSALNQLFVQATHCHTFKDGICCCLEDAVGEMPISSDIMQKDCSAEPESVRIEQAPHLHMEHALHFNSLKAFKSQGGEKIINAFDLLQSNPSVQRMVVSLSSDKAVWDAVMRNRAVQELKKSFSAVGSTEPQSSSGGPDINTRILRWILENTMIKIMECIDKITMLVNELFHPGEREKDMGVFDDLLRSSFMLSVMVLIVVVVTRLQRT